MSDTANEPTFIFFPRKRRAARFGKYRGLPAVVLFDNPNGRRLVDCGGQRFSVYPDELTALKRPIHGSPQNYRFDNEGNLK